MFDRYDAGEQAVLVHIYFSQDKDMEDLQEFESLVSSAGVEAMQVITGSRKAPHPKYFVGEGKAVEIADAVKATGASVVLFDHALTPAPGTQPGTSVRMSCYRSNGFDFRHFCSTCAYS
ncbi:GTP-binding protein HflX [Leclercia adecarboxylata]|uniref:GTP-binding protein HflX n=1 Tax=Leclercia adecarboxylata TaxID=83655 RepID=A0A4U9HIA2_9ENTR|nr:GTP-binding protein HflX [Leclercia adecarboxylata]